MQQHLIQSTGHAAALCRLDEGKADRVPVAELLRIVGYDHGGSDWRRAQHRAAAELRRRAMAGKLGRRHLPALDRLGSSDVPMLVAENLQCCAIAIRFPGRSWTTGWSAFRYGTPKPLKGKP